MFDLSQCYLRYLGFGFLSPAEGEEIKVFNED
jgi:hypothetical protein